MKFQSTRGIDKGRNFEDVLIATYAKDGGLYVPEELPMLTFDQLLNWSTLSFPEICAEILHIYSDIPNKDLNTMTNKAFSLFNIGNEQPLPLTKIDDSNNILLLDTSLGPTFAFKDIGQQVIGQLLNYVLGRQGKRANIVVETSGDTGPAAIAAVRGCPFVDIYCLYPSERVSSVQELQMVTIHDENVHVFRAEGDSDEQASVLKELFRDEKFVNEYNICSINSINFVRIIAQSSYYVWAYLQIYNTLDNIGKIVNFSVPTGAFGNAMGGFLAKKMGLPLGKIICATNANDIVYRTISKGDMSMGINMQTESPAMDIQFAYNLERMLYYICNENTSIIKNIMIEVEEQYNYIPGAKGVQLDNLIINRIQEVFSACSVNDTDTLSTMKDFHKKEIFLCPHSAIGVNAVYLPLFKSLVESAPMICVLTAHPAKFEEAVVKAIGIEPYFPPSIVAMKLLPHKFKWLHKNDLEGFQKGWRERWINKLKDCIISRNL